MQELRVIKSEQDYEAALRRVASLMDASAESPEGNELEVLATLVEAYESEHFPIEPPSPIDAIKFRMEQGGLTQTDLVPFIGSRSRVSEVLAGKRALNLRMIRALHEGLGIPLASLVGKDHGESEGLLPDELIKHTPVAEMAKRFWFSDFDGDGHAARAAADRLLVEFYKRRDSQALQGCLNRRTRSQATAQSPATLAALNAWQTRVANLAGSVELPKFEPTAITPEFARQLVGLSLLETGPVAAGEYLAKYGIALVVLAHLPSTRLDGSAMRLQGGTPVIGLTVRHDRLDHFWFTLLHELGHVALHLKGSESGAFLDELEGQESIEDVERAADAFAAEALLPAAEWHSALRGGLATASAISTTALRLRVHVSIVAGRVRRDRNDFRTFSKLVGKGEVRRHFPELERGQVVCG